MNLGPRIRKARLMRHLTLEDVAGACGFTRSLLSKIENGKTSPPVATLTKIAAALKSSVASLLDDSHAQGSLFTRASSISAKSMIETRAGYSFFAFAGNRGDKRMQPYLFVARKGKVKKTSLTHAGEEFIYVVSGEMEYRVGDVTYTLKPGDSLYFDSSEEHGLSPITAEVRYLGIFVEPAEQN
jgi:transcriptional regulator with XRE-family HTH domain